jgi:hypothetical protein
MDPRGSQPLRIVGTLVADTATLVSRTHSWTRRATLSPSFLFGATQRGSLIALGLLELAQRRVQQGDRGARPVADGEWRVAMSADSYRVFRWPERSRWPAQWGLEWPERLPVLRPLTAPTLPIA